MMIQGFNYSQQDNSPSMHDFRSSDNTSVNLKSCDPISLTKPDSLQEEPSPANPSTLEKIKELSYKVKRKKELEQKRIDQEILKARKESGLVDNFEAFLNTKRLYTQSFGKEINALVGSEDFQTHAIDLAKAILRIIETNSQELKNIRDDNTAAEEVKETIIKSKKDHYVGIFKNGKEIILPAKLVHDLELDADKVERPDHLYNDLQDDSILSVLLDRYNESMSEKDRRTFSISVKEVIHAALDGNKERELLEKFTDTLAGSASLRVDIGLTILVLLSRSLRLVKKPALDDQSYEDFVGFDDCTQVGRTHLQSIHDSYNLPIKDQNACLNEIYIHLCELSEPEFQRDPKNAVNYMARDYCLELDDNPYINQMGSQLRKDLEAGNESSLDLLESRYKSIFICSGISRDDIKIAAQQGLPSVFKLIEQIVFDTKKRGNHDLVNSACELTFILYKAFEQGNIETIRNEKQTSSIPGTQVSSNKELAWQEDPFEALKQLYKTNNESMQHRVASERLISDQRKIINTNQAIIDGLVEGFNGSWQILGENTRILADKYSEIYPDINRFYPASMLRREHYNDLFSYFYNSKSELKDPTKIQKTIEVMIILGEALLRSSDKVTSK